MSRKNWLRASAYLLGPAALLLLAFVPTRGLTQAAQDKEVVPAPGSRSLPGLTGFTRPGYPDDVVNREGKILPAGYEKAGSWVLGGTVYFTVLERARGASGDAYGTGIKDFNHSFVRGVNGAGDPSPGLDTSARYLYLYQVINDRTVEGAEKTEKDLVPITGVSVRLIVDPGRITSWGHFTGVGFQAHFKPGKKAAEPAKGAAAVKEDGDVVLPVSAATFLVPKKQTASTRMYLQQSPAYRAAQSFTLARITEGREEKSVKESGVAHAAFGDMVLKKALEPTHDPDRVVLLRATSTSSRKAIWPFAEGRGADGRGADGEGRSARENAAGTTAEEDVGSDADDGARGVDQDKTDKEEVMATSSRKRTTRGAVRAIWTARQPLRPFARGSVFGFTCNLPPVFDGVNLRPLVARAGAAEHVPIIPAATEGVVSTVAASGTVPALGVVPTPIDRAIVPAAAEVGGFALGLNTLSTIGGQVPGSFNGGFGGGTAAGGFAPAGGGFGGGGAGFGGGSGGGGNQGNVPLATQQQQQQQQTPNGLTQTVSVNVSANANASATATATASATTCGNCNSGGEIVPAPPALILAGMGLPVLWLLYRRRKASYQPT